MVYWAQAVVYVMADLQQLPHGADLSNDLDSILCIGKQVVLVEDNEMMVFISRSWIGSRVVSTTHPLSGTVSL